MRISQRAAAIQDSPTLALDTRVKALAAAGRDVLNMAVGEPDFLAPAVATAAARAKVDTGAVRYTPAAGLPSLRAVAAQALNAASGAAFGPANVTICHSGKHALSGALLALIEPGDEVLLPLPAWVSYVELVRLAGGVPIGVPPAAGTGARPDLAALAAAVTPRTRGILVNSPNNPSGYLWTRAELEAVCDLAGAEDLWLLSDEIYRRLVFPPGEFVSPLHVAEGALRERIVVIDGASKSFAMTGYRIGFLAGPEPLAAAVGRLHSQTTGSPNAISQVAFEAALTAELQGGPPELEASLAAYQARRDVLLAGLAALDLELVRPDGAFYAFPDVTRFCVPGPDGAPDTGAFCADLLEATGLALVPGDAFLCPGFVRLSYALSIERIEDALARLGRFLRERRSRAGA